MKPNIPICLALLVCVLFSCKKKHDDATLTPAYNPVYVTGTKDLKISSLDYDTYSGSYKRYKFFYSGSGSLDTILIYNDTTVAGSYSRFIYNDTGYTLYMGFSLPITIVTNKLGLITSRICGPDCHSTFEYDGYRIMKSNIAAYPSNDIASYIWDQRGNIIAHADSNGNTIDSVTISYDTTLQSFIDFNRIEEFIQDGRSHTITNNPLTSITSPWYSIYYTYKYDSFGRVADIKMNRKIKNIGSPAGYMIDSGHYKIHY